MQRKSRDHVIFTCFSCSKPCFSAPNTSGEATTANGKSSRYPHGRCLVSRRVSERIPPTLSLSVTFSGSNLVFFSRRILSQCFPICYESNSPSFTEFGLKMRENGLKMCEGVRLPAGCGSGCAPPCDRIRPDFSSHFIIELIHMVST
jgi:hypothetical protein